VYADEVDAEAEARNVNQLSGMRPELVRISDSVTLALGLGNVFLIETDGGHVIVDTGVAQQAALQRELLLGQSPGAVSHVIVTHAHGDHAGGVPLYTRDGAELVVQRRFLENRVYETTLAPIMARRNGVFWGGFVKAPPSDPQRPKGPPPLEPNLVVDDSMALEIGGRRFELLHTPSESSDMLTVWLPDERIAFTGDLYGSSFPNLYTLRGHYYRSALDYVRSLNRLIALEPEILAPSHFRPIVGKESVRQALTELRDAVQFVHDETVRGMNEGKDLWTLMQEIELPAESPVGQSHGSLDWGVRAIWEGYLGWFRHERTTEIYPVPASSVHSDLVDLAGGPEAIVARAREHLDAGRPVEALHLLDICQGTAEGHRGVLETRLAALQALAGQAGGNFSRLGWLRHRISEVKKNLELQQEAVQ